VYAGLKKTAQHLTVTEIADNSNSISCPLWNVVQSSSGSMEAQLRSICGSTYLSASVLLQGIMNHHRLLNSQRALIHLILYSTADFNILCLSSTIEKGWSYQPDKTPDFQTHPVFLYGTSMAAPLLAFALNWKSRERRPDSSASEKAVLNNIIEGVFYVRIIQQ
jgi:hypothetical protein